MSSKGRRRERERERERNRQQSQELHLRSKKRNKPPSSSPQRSSCQRGASGAEGLADAYPCERSCTGRKEGREKGRKEEHHHKVSSLETLWGHGQQLSRFQVGNGGHLQGAVRVDAIDGSAHVLENVLVAEARSVVLPIMAFGHLVK